MNEKGRERKGLKCEFDEIFIIDGRKKGRGRIGKGGKDRKASKKYRKRENEPKREIQGKVEKV